MKLDSEQRRIAQRIVSIGRRKGATPKEIESAIETGLVESNLRNLPGGDADSQGWRQERASLYKDPRNLDASINRYYDETRAVRGKYGSSGELAAAVQRPAAQYRGRYEQRDADAEAILAQLGAGGAGSAGGRETLKVEMPGADREEFDAAGFEKAKRQHVLAQYLQRRRPDSVLLKVLPTEAPTEQQFTRTVPTTETQTYTRQRADAAAAPRAGGGPSANLVKSMQWLDRLAGQGGVPVTAKQEQGHAVGGDHDPSVRNASARDFGGSEEAREALFRRLTQSLGVRGAKYKGQDINVVVDGLRYQIISRDHGSGPHLHVGVRKA